MIVTTASAQRVWKCVFNAAVALCNQRFGQWNICAFFHETTLGAVNACLRMTADDPLVLKFWPRIVVGKGLEQEPRVYSNARREQFINQELVTTHATSSHWEKVAPHTWMSFHKGLPLGLTSF